VPLETATYTSQLVSSNPAHSDGLNNADAHMRLIKGTIQATFPNFTAAALASTQAQLDSAATAVNTNGVTILADAGVNFKTNTTDGLRNPAAGTVNVSSGGVTAASFTASASTVAGTLGVTGLLTGTAGFSGPGAIPIGTPLMWLTDTLPTGFGTWYWANGAAISRTVYATLFALIGTTYGAGDGSTTFSLPNWQEVALVGKSTMGGVASPGLLPSIASGIKTVLGKLFGNDTTTLATANLPPYTPAGTVAITQINSGGFNVGGGSTQLLAPPGNGSLYINSGTFTGTAQGGTSTAFSNLPPMQTVNFIIRLL
jgi:microcystin-dependent protein